MGGVDAAISAWTADLCHKTLGKEPSKEGGKKYATLVRAAQDRELASWKEFEEFCPMDEAQIKRTIADTRWEAS